MMTRSDDPFPRGRGRLCFLWPIISKVMCSNTIRIVCVGFCNFAMIVLRNQKKSVTWQSEIFVMIPTKIILCEEWKAQ